MVWGPPIKNSGYAYGRILWSLEKHELFVFRENGMQWSSLRIKFPNFRFEDFHFLRIFVNIFRTKKSSAENFFVWPKIFLFVTNIFFPRKKIENGSKCLRISANLRINSRILLITRKILRRFFCWRLKLVSPV